MNRSIKQIVVLYGLILAFLATRRPLWLDELMQLTSTYQRSCAQTLHFAALNPGGVPLGYLGQYAFVNALGHPVYTAHLFSIFCAMIGLASLLWLTQLLGIGDRWLWVALAFSALPLSLRYAVEARPYGAALAACILATALLVRLEQQPNFWRAFLYGAAVAIGIYLQPYSAFVAVAHFLWLWRRPAAKYVFFAGVCAALSFVPWYLYARTLWIRSVTGRGFTTLTWRILPIIFRELSGGGYWLTGALLVLAWLGYRRTTMPKSTRHLLLLWAVVPLPLVILANSFFHYFFAIRQLFFVIPALCLLAVEGWLSIHGRWRLTLAIVLMVVAGIYDVRWFTQWKEDWSLSAAAARQMVRPGTCVAAIPNWTADFYKLYQPLLPLCQEGAAQGNASVLLVAPFAAPGERQAVGNAQPLDEMGGIAVFHR